MAATAASARSGRWVLGPVPVLPCCTSTGLARLRSAAESPRRLAVCTCVHSPSNEAAPPTASAACAPPARSCATTPTTSAAACWSWALTCWATGTHPSWCAACGCFECGLQNVCFACALHRLCWKRGKAPVGWHRARQRCAYISYPQHCRPQLWPQLLIVASAPRPSRSPSCCSALPSCPQCRDTRWSVAW